jgi:dihydrofolate reductase
MSKPTVAAIVAMDEGRVIGKDGALPWHLPEDLAYFKAQTSGHFVIMGRKTWNSLPPKFRPLPGRVNIVVSRNPDALELPEGTFGARSVEEALAIAERAAKPEQKVWFIGGAELYAGALSLCDELHLTLVHGHHAGDATFPRFEDRFERVSSEKGERCTFQVYRAIESLR